MIIVNNLGEKQIVVQLGETDDSIKRQMTELALENNNWIITHAAASIGINRTTMIERMKSWGIRKPGADEKKDPAQAN